MDISVLYHACIRIADSDYVFYFDPYKVLDEKHDASFIFITHDHYDHYDTESIEKVSNSDTKIFVPKCLSTINNYKVLDVGEVFNYNDIFEVKTIRSYNNTKPYHKKEYDYLGYILKYKNTTFYIMGDTDRTIDTDSVSNIDYCFVPIGGEYTMDYKEASSYINYIKPKYAIPIHYGSITGDLSLGEKFRELVNDDIVVYDLLNKKRSD